MVECLVNGKVFLKLKTSKNLFSPGGIDRGTLAMLTKAVIDKNDKVLDLGCGFGAVGIYAAKLIGADRVVMTDIDEDAVSTAKENAKLNDVEGVRIVCGNAYESIDDNDFTMILVNPPYHADFSVPKLFIEKGFNRLRLNGRMYMVTRRKQWYRNKLTAIFGGVIIYEIDGYYVFMSEKKSCRYAGRK